MKTTTIWHKPTNPENNSNAVVIRQRLFILLRMKMRGNATIILAVIFTAISFVVSAQDIQMPQIQDALLAPVPPALTPDPSFDETLATSPAPPVFDSQPSFTDNSEAIELTRAGSGFLPPQSSIVPPSPDFQVQFNGGIQPAPEPSTLALGSLAFGLIALTRLHKRH